MQLFIVVSLQEQKPSRGKDKLKQRKLYFLTCPSSSSLSDLSLLLLTLCFTAVSSAFRV